MEDFAELGSRDVYRLLHLFERFNKGEVMSKQMLSKEYAVSEKTIQRDIEDLRYYLSNIHYKSDKALQYNQKQKGYILTEKVWHYQTNQQILALMKILLASRAFPKNEMDTLLNNLLLCAAPEQRNTIKEVIRNEWYHYQPVKTQNALLDLLWNLSGYIQQRRIITFDYTRQDGKIFNRQAIPASILFSEYYFYLAAYYTESDKKYPAILRIDRMENVKTTSEKGYIPYAKRFEDGKMRHKVQFMYGGEAMVIKFKYWGPSLQAVLDKLPTARIIGQDETGKHIIESETFGKGIKMWLLSQMDKLEVLEPASFRKEMRDTIQHMRDIYMSPDGGDAD